MLGLAKPGVVFLSLHGDLNTSTRAQDLIFQVSKSESIQLVVSQSLVAASKVQKLVFGFNYLGDQKAGIISIRTDSQVGLEGPRPGPREIWLDVSQG
jgi:hypothetical protein